MTALGHFQQHNRQGGRGVLKSGLLNLVLRGFVYAQRYN